MSLRFRHGVSAFSARRQFRCPDVAGLVSGNRSPECRSPASPVARCDGSEWAGAAPPIVPTPDAPVVGGRRAVRRGAAPGHAADRRLAARYARLRAPARCPRAARLPAPARCPRAARLPASARCSRPARSRPPPGGLGPPLRPARLTPRPARPTPTPHTCRPHPPVGTRTRPDAATRGTTTPTTTRPPTAAPLAPESRPTPLPRLRMATARRPVPAVRPRRTRQARAGHRSLLRPRNRRPSHPLARPAGHRSPHGPSYEPAGPPAAHTAHSGRRHRPGTPPPQARPTQERPAPCRAAPQAGGPKRDGRQRRMAPPRRPRVQHPPRRERRRPASSSPARSP